MQLRGNQLKLPEQRLQPLESTMSSGREFKDEIIRALEQSREKVFYSNNYSTVSGQFKMKIGDIPFPDKLTSNSRQKLSSGKPRTSIMRSDIRYMQMMDRFVQGLGEKEPEELSPHKLKILKQLLEHYNVKHLNRQNYQKLTNTFGLKIQSVKYEEAPKKIQFVYQKPSTSVGGRNTRMKGQGRMEPSLEVHWQNNAQEGEQDQKDKLRSQSRQLQRSRNNTSDSRYRPFMMATDCDSFEYKLRKYKQFLFMINLSNEVYRDMEMHSYDAPLKMYIGRGNNSNLIRSLMRKRFWFMETHTIKQANFVWTQIKTQGVFQRQPITLELTTKAPAKQEKLKKRRQSLSFSKKRGARQVQPNQPLLKILNQTHFQQYKDLAGPLCFGLRRRDDFQFKLKLLRKKPQMAKTPYSQSVLHNHLPKNGLLGNKKAMFYSVRQYYRLTGKDVFTIVPLTYHIQKGVNDQEFKKFTNCYNQRKKNKISNIWIIKPGQFTNRGNGISCSSKLQQIRKIVSGCSAGGKQHQRTFIIQSYICRPLLYHKRKFDIRAYMLITINNGILKGYWYQEGYIRTSSQIFDLEDLADTMIHLTNDAVQKHGDQYGLYEPGNKLTYNDLQRYIDSCGHKIDFFTAVYPQMRRIATDCVTSTCLFLDPERRQNNFEVFGLDFMIDEDFKVWLIEVNTNPCLQLSCGILQRLIPQMVENALRIALDPQFPPPNQFPPTKKYTISQNALLYNKFELVFDELRDGYSVSQLYTNTSLIKTIGIVHQDKEQYTDEGKLIEIVAD